MTESPLDGEIQTLEFVLPEVPEGVADPVDRLLQVILVAFEVDEAFEYVSTLRFGLSDPTAMFRRYGFRALTAPF